MWIENTCFCHNAATQWLTRGTNHSVRVLRQQPEREDSEMRLLYNLIFRNTWVATCQYWDVTKALYTSLHLPCPLLFFPPISRAASLIFGKVTHWRRPGRGRPVRRKSRRSPPRTGVHTRCCRRSALTAGWRSWDGAGSCRRRCFGPGNHGRPSEALCCCCCLYDWVQIIQTQLSALLSSAPAKQKNKWF